MASDGKTISLFDQVITALGGTGAAAEALGRNPSQICQWRAKDQRFPAEMFFVVQKAAKKKLPRRLFRFEERKAKKKPAELVQLEDERRAG